MAAGLIPFLHLLESVVEQRQEKATEVLLFWIVEVRFEVYRSGAS